MNYTTVYDICVIVISFTAGVICGVAASGYFHSEARDHEKHYANIREDMRKAYAHNMYLINELNTYK